jgi:hypothetical protein
LRWETTLVAAMGGSPLFAIDCQICGEYNQPILLLVWHIRKRLLAKFGGLRHCW